MRREERGVRSERASEALRAGTPALPASAYIPPQA